MLLLALEGSDSQIDCCKQQEFVEEIEFSLALFEIRMTLLSDSAIETRSKCPSNSGFLTSLL